MITDEQKLISDKSIERLGDYMTRQEATKVYIKENPKAKQIIERIMAWDRKKNLTQNAVSLRMPYMNAVFLLRKYKLVHSGKRGRPWKKKFRQ